jgi:ankyrin repeat protein
MSDLQEDINKTAVELALQYMSELNKELVNASRNGNFIGAKLLIGQGADINADNGSVLNYAVRRNNIEMVKWLIKRNVNIHAGRNYALCIAAKKGYLDIVKCLVESSSTESIDKNEAIVIAAKRGYYKIASYLLRCKQAEREHSDGKRRRNSLPYGIDINRIDDPDHREYRELLQNDKF